MKTWLLAAFVLAAWTAGPAISRQSIGYEQAIELHRKVATGEVDFQNLTPSQQQSVLLVDSLSRRSCSSNSHKCQALCDAAEHLRIAADDLSACAAKHDSSDSCDSLFNEARDAHDELEDAVSASDGDCD